MAEQEAMSGKMFVGLGALGVALLCAWYFGSPYLFKDGPPPATRIGGEAIETAPAPPDVPVLSDRVRLFFVKGGSEKCLEEHLGKGLRVDGQLAVTLKPDGAAVNPETKTEPNNPGVAICITNRFSKGFAFTGEPQRVTYTFNGHWENDKLQFGQNVSSAAAER